MYRRFFLELAWFSGWLPALVALLTIALLRSRRWFFLALVGTLILGAAQYEVILDTQVSGGDSASNALRLDLWAQNMEVTRDHLLIGTGVAGYALYYMTYFVDTGLSTHSNYIDIFSQTGIIGSFFFVWFLVALFRVGLAVRRRYPTGFVAGFASSAIGGFMGLLVAMSLGDWFIPFVYNQTIEGFRYTVHSWILLGALASLQYAEER